MNREYHYEATYKEYRYEVTWVFQDKIELHCPIFPKACVNSWLKSHSAKRSLLNPHHRFLAFRSKEELAECFAELRDLGFVFWGGHGWPPSAIFEDLRNKEMLHGNFIEVVWTGSHNIYTEK